MLTLKSWTSFFNKETPELYETVKVRAPRDFFNRAEVFIEDIQYTTNQELLGMNITFLVKLLFDNFLDHVRQDKDLYDYLLDLRETYSHFLTTNPNVVGNNLRDINRVAKFQWSLSNVSSLASTRDYLTLNIDIHPKEVNRIAVFFDDWDCKYEIPLGMDLNELLSLLFIEFITELRNGLAEETKKEIIASILKKWEER
ncbi:MULTISPECIES: hypothetical protein [unclassified Paenibacillus]|uniref:hypothetical protein n=1 Tax=unclassified Paenibacillus TaxID=185978 RepID=UPI0027880EEC|nr:MULTISPECIES: hypothetical protein [unclassified Paenibacillus]MDQ0897276.1 hypothetical protein [Paenibacillus sp. V4I7]MDQ0916577.1 hypothetical protein [Paenibacillus sp. V4I5]